MKKLLFFTVAIGLFVGLYAQQGQVREPAPNPIREAEKVTAQPVKSATMLNTQKTTVQKSHKGTDAVNYTPLPGRTDRYAPLIGNLDHATIELEKLPIFWESGKIGSIDLFPDSLAYQVRLNVSDLDTFKTWSVRGIGFVFDPYSKSFDQYGQENLFKMKDTLPGWKVDVIGMPADYRMAEGFDTLSPDTLRCYAFVLDEYADRSDSGIYYRTTYFIENDGSPMSPPRQALVPYMKYIDNPIPDKGNAIVPLTENCITWDYILGTEDSLMIDTGFINYRFLEIEIPNDGIEMPPGSVLCFFLKYIPGFAYQLDDTLVYSEYNKDAPEGYQYKEQRFKNTFTIFRWAYDTDKGEELFYYDSKGYSTSLMEDNRVRYNLEDEETGRYYGPNYQPGYHFRPVFFLHVYQGDNIIRDPRAPAPSAIAQIGDIVSNIYPNPATTQLTIDLKEEGRADVTIYNVLGQAIQQESLNNLQTTIDIANLPAGVYMVKVMQNNKAHTVKLFKE